MTFIRVGVFLMLFGGLLLAAERPRVFITDSKSWEISGSAGGSSAAFGAQTRGGARPQTAEIIKTFGERCPDVTINNKQEKADYVVLLDHEGGKGWIRKDNKVAVFNYNGDSILSRSTRSLGNSVQDACNAIKKDWADRAQTGSRSERSASSFAPQPGATNPAGSSGVKVQVASDPAGADIEVDGSFVGNTPSTIELTVGEHTVVVKKAGFKTWERNIKTSGGSISLAAQLEKAQ